MTPTNPEPGDQGLVVTQADRDAAVSLMEAVFGEPVTLEDDGGLVVQAFVRHRTNATSPLHEYHAASEALWAANDGTLDSLSCGPGLLEKWQRFQRAREGVPFGPGSRPTDRTGCAVSAVSASIPDAWQPIETAPKEIDATIWVLDSLYSKPWHYECIWNGVQWYHGFGDAWPAANPTHWMPLPAPPAQGIETASAAETGTGSVHESPVGSEADDAPKSLFERMTDFYRKAADAPELPEDLPNPSVSMVSEQGLVDSNWRAIGSTLGFFASAIKSGEPWTQTCEEMRLQAVDAIIAIRTPPQGNNDEVDARDALLKLCETLGIPATACAYLDAPRVISETRRDALEEGYRAGFCRGAARSPASMPPTGAEVTAAWIKWRDRPLSPQEPE